MEKGRQSWTNAPRENVRLKQKERKKILSTPFTFVLRSLFCYLSETEISWASELKRGHRFVIENKPMQTFKKCLLGEQFCRYFVIIFDEQRLLLF